MKTRKITSFVTALSLLLLPALPLTASAAEGSAPTLENDKESREVYFSLSDTDECIAYIGRTEEYYQDVVNASLDELVYEKCGLHKSDVFSPPQEELDKELENWTQADEARAQAAADPEFYKQSTLKKRIEERKRPVYEQALSEIDMVQFYKDESRKLCEAIGIDESEIVILGVRDVVATVRFTKARLDELFPNDKAIVDLLFTPEGYDEMQKRISEGDPEPEVVAVPEHEHVWDEHGVGMEHYREHTEGEVIYTEWQDVSRCTICGMKMWGENRVETRDVPYYEKQAYKDAWNALEPWEKKLGDPEIDGIPSYLKKWRAAEDGTIFIADVWIVDRYEEYCKEHPESEYTLHQDSIDTYSDELMSWTSEDEKALLDMLGLEKPEDNIALYENNKKNIISSRELSKKIDDEITRSLMNQRDYYTAATQEAARELGLTDNQIVRLDPDAPLLMLCLTKEEVKEVAMNDLVTWVGFDEGGMDTDLEVDTDRIDLETDIDYSDDVHSETEDIKTDIDIIDYYDLYDDNSLNYPVPSEGNNLTTTIGEFDYYDIENGAVGFFGTRIPGIRCVKVPYLVKWGDKYKDVSWVMNKALEGDEYAEVVELPNTIECVYERAFAGMKKVKRIYVPKSVRYIAADAFESIPEDFKIVCAKGSYAEEYAKKHNIPYVYPEDDDFRKEAAENSQRDINGLRIYIDGEIDLTLPRIYEYMNDPITPEVLIYEEKNNNYLVNDKDYTVVYSDNDKPGMAHITITGKDKYRGICEYDFEIKSYEQIVRFDVTKETPDFYNLYTDNGVDLSRPYCGSFDTINTFDGYNFQSNDNGTVDFYSAKDGIWYLKIRAMFEYGWYYDRPDFTMEIRAKSLMNNEEAQAVDIPNTVVNIGDEAFKGMKSVKRIYVPVSVKRIGENAFDELPEDFRLVCVKGSYAEEYAKANNVPYIYPEDDDFDKQALEKAQPDIKDLTVLIGGLVLEPFDSEPALNLEYTGEAITPTVEIKDGDKVLTPDADYTVNYINNTSTGTARIIIKGINGYKGYLIYYFAIKAHKDMMPHDPIMGDLDGDNSVTSSDALFTLRASLDMQELDEDQLLLADIDRDGEITSADALGILRLSAEF